MQNRRSPLQSAASARPGEKTENTDEYRSSYFGLSRDEVIDFVPTGARRVLEVGCGSGVFRRHFPGDVEYWGIEPEEGPAREAAKHLTKVLHGRFDDSKGDLPENYFDLVVCNDVIEHMPDHRGFLRDVQHVVVPGGALVGSVPNVRLLTNLARLLIKRDWQYLEEGVLDYTHLRFFTKKSWTRELASSGLEVERVVGINPLGSKEHGLDRLFKIVASSAGALLMGGDTRFVQIGFRARTPK
jgi:2-polyprenyl-3-methyl-5-hydroxy-6-metoxy-1,4-benzoquinol methylase